MNAWDRQTQGRGLEKSHRLRKPEEFRFVTRRSRHLSCECFTVLFRANDLGRARLGLAIARRHVRHAPQRNTVKRIVREAFRHRRWELERAARGLDVVFISRPTLAEKDKRELRVMVDSLLEDLTRCANS